MLMYCRRSTPPLLTSAKASPTDSITEAIGIAAQLNEIGGLWRFVNVEGPLADRVEEISRSGDSVGLAGGDDIKLACGSHIWASEDWRGYKALADSGMINGKSLR